MLKFILSMPTLSTENKAFLEETLARRFDRRFCVLTNRGTTALTAAFRGLNLAHGSGVLFPAALCSIPVFSAAFSGCVPHFADVNLKDANFDLESVERALRLAQGKIKAIVPVHMFGKPDDVAALKDLSRKHGAVVVEDCALALGADVGRLGDAAVLSFVRKMVPIEMGGAVLTDDLSVATRARAFTDSLPTAKPQGDLDAAMKAFHRTSGFVATTGWSRRDLLAPYQDLFKDLMLLGTKEEDWQDSVVLKELESVEDIVQGRRARAEVYQSALQHPYLETLDMTGSCLFTYPVRLKGIAVESLLDFAKKQDVRFSRVAYPDISPIFQITRGLANAQTLERELIGMPLDNEEPVSHFWGYAEDFVKILEEYIQAGAPESDVAGRLEMRMGEGSPL